MDNSQQIFNQMQARFKQAFNTMPVVIANEMVNFTKERFAKQDWLDNMSQPWQKRKGNKGKGRAILVDTARLKRSPRPITKTDMAGIAMDVPYAKAHNDGVDETVTVKSFSRNKYSKTKVKGDTGRAKTVTSISGSGMVKSHTRKMKLPRRRFAGPSANMMERLKKAALAHINKYVRQ